MQWCKVAISKHDPLIFKLSAEALINAFQKRMIELALFDDVQVYVGESQDEKFYLFSPKASEFAKDILEIHNGFPVSAPESVEHLRLLKL